MKVYIVMGNSWESNEVLGVFSSRDKAKFYIEKKYSKYKYDIKFDSWYLAHKSIDILQAIIDDEEKLFKDYFQR